MVALDQIRCDLESLVGLPIWGIKRSIGSSIFIELGDPIYRVGERTVHGYSHFLLQMMSWRVCGLSGLIVGSDSPQPIIDKEFEIFSPGNVGTISIDEDGAVVIIEGTNDFKIMASWNGLGQEQVSNAWILFIGLDKSWAFSTDKTLSIE